MNSQKTEQEKPGKTRKKNVRGWIYFKVVFFTLAFAMVVYSLVMSYLAPVKKIEALTKAMLISENDQGGFTSISDTGILNLLKEEAHLKSRLAMAAQDSVCLNVNLHSNLVTLEIQGITVHVSKISKVRKSRLIDNVDPQIMIRRFSVPQNIDSVEATFPKLVFTHKEAPADTNQQSQLVIPDTATIEPAYLKMFLNDDFILTFRETGDLHKKELNKFVRERQWDYSVNFLKSITEFKVPDYTPWIEIEIPARDIRTIYRSIPYKALVTVRI